MWYILNPKYTAVGVIDNSIPNGLPLISDSRTQRLENGYDTLNFEVPANHPKTSLLEVEGFIIYPSKDGKHQMYRIKGVNDKSGDEMVKTVRCEPAATADLIGKRIRPVTYSSQNITQIVTSLLANTGWVLGDSFYDSLMTIEFSDYPTSLEAIRSTIATFGAEIEFTVLFDGLRVIKKVVNLFEKRGDETNVIFEYEKNLQGLVRDEDTSNLVSAMIGIGPEDSNGNRLIISNSGVTPPAPFRIIGDMVVDDDCLDRWFDDNVHREGIYNDTSVQSARELYEKTLAELKKFNKPRLTYEVEVLQFEKLTGYEYSKTSIGDTILIKDRTFSPPQYVNARVLEKTDSEVDPTRGAIVLGEFVQLEVKPIPMILQLQRKISIREEEWNKANEKAQEALDKANESAVVYQVKMFSTKGTVFKNGAVSTDLYMVVYRGNSDITAQLPANAFIWKKYNRDGVLDQTWTNNHVNVGPLISINATDVYERATFTCDVDIVEN